VRQQEFIARRRRAIDLSQWILCAQLFSNRQADRGPEAAETA